MKGKVIVILLFGFTLLLAYLKDKPVLYANNRSYQVYEVIIGGAVGDRPFNRSGTLFVRSGSNHPEELTSGNLVDFWLVSGKPAGTAGKGAIWLATSSIFYGSGQETLLASVSAQDSVLVAEMFPEFGGGNKNAFSLSAQRAENASEISAGQVRFQLRPSGHIEGSLNLTGFNPDSQSFLVYEATISGQYVGEQSW
jgi:hypothetical protein